MIARALVLMLLLVAATAGAVNYTDQGTAYAGCMATGAAAGPIARPPNGTTGATGVVKCDFRAEAASGKDAYFCQFQTKLGTGGTGFLNCAEAQGYENYHYYPNSKKCSIRELAPGGANMLFVGAGAGTGICYQGCWYANGTTTTSTRIGGTNKAVITSNGLAPDGSVCGEAPQVSQPEQCVPDGTLTQCVKADGTHCAQASTGAKFCWANNEAGVKVATNGNEAATKSPDGAGINAPRTPPMNGGDWQVVGQSTTSITTNNTTTNYNTTNFQSTYGPSGSGGGSGGSGGDGGGGEDGGGEDDGDTPGGVGEGAGEIYQGTDLSIGGLVTEYYGKISDTPMLASVRSFMLVSGGGSCPVFSMPATAWTPALQFDAHCSGQVYSVLLAMGWVVFGVVSYLAIRIAVT